MRAIRYMLLLMVIGLLFSSACPYSQAAGDYDSRFVRNYPPGYHGMWYYAERFWKYDPIDQESSPERSRWDRFMSRLTDTVFPFWPIPYDWDYGTGPVRYNGERTSGEGRTFNLPNYNSNDWY